VLRPTVPGFGRRGVLRRGVLGSGRWSAVLIIAMATLAWASGAAASTCKAIHVFNRPGGGARPLGSLTRDAAGNLYGTTEYGGGTKECFAGCGTVWKLAPNPDGTWRESVLHNFSVADGVYPYAGVIFDAAGNLYGTTREGGPSAGGVVFKL